MMDDKPLIDWFTVVAQIINFLILVLALKYLLYGKIIAAMDERQRTLSAQFEEAGRKEQLAEQAQQDYQQRLLEFRDARDMALALAQQDADRQKHQWLTKSRTEIEAQRERWYEALQEESAAYLDDLRRKIADGALHIARSTLTDLADADLEAGIVNTFLRRIHAVPKSERDAMVKPLQTGNGQLLVQSAFAMSPDLKDKVTHDLTPLFPGNRQLRFETNPGLLCGIRLATSDQQMLWELGQRLDEVADQIRTSVAGPGGPPHGTEVPHELHA